MKADAQEQFDTLLVNTDTYTTAILAAVVHAIDNKQLSPEAALTTILTVAAKLSDQYLGGVDAFEYWANDYIEFVRNRTSETVQ